MKKIIIISLTIICNLQIGHAQSVNELNQYGIASIFLGGAFKAGMTVGQIKHKGEFGIAAPSMTDGELIEFDGTIYQTKSNGETKPAPDSLKIPFGMFCHFKPDTIFTIRDAQTQESAEQLIRAALKNQNGVYFIRISGTFTRMQTRAFHKVNSQPFPSIAELQANQQVFNYSNVQGTLCGYYMPVYMKDISGTGYHFHFLSSDYLNGGHVLSFSPGKVIVEVALLHDLSITAINDN